MPKPYPVSGQVFVPAIAVAPSGVNGGVVIGTYSNVNLTPAVTGNAILDSYVLPAFALDRPGTGLYITAFATTAANVNSKTLAINFAGTGAVGVAPVNGTVIVTQATTASGASLLVEVWVFKTAASAQTYAGYGTAGAALAAPTTGTLSVADTGGIQVNLVMNNATAAGDSTVQFWQIQYLG